MKFAKRVLDASPNPIFALVSKAQELQRAGESVIRFDVGETDFPAPEHVKAAVKKAVDANQSFYTAAGGILELRKAVAEKFAHENGIPAKPEEVMVTAGGKQALYNATQCLLEEGDEAVVPVPYWVTHLEQVKLARAKPVLVETDERFKLRARAVEKHLTDATKMIFLVSPSNPTGAVIDKRDLERFAELAVERNLWLVSDEIYEDFYFNGGKHESIASFSEEVRRRTLTVNALSKSFAMTGWRVGYVHAPAGLVKKMIYLQSHSTSNVNSLAQHAALAALRGSKEPVKAMVAEFAKRRTVVCDGLNAIPGMKCLEPEAAIYVFPNVEAVFNESVPDSPALCNYLLEEAKVTVVPGEAAGAPGFVRLCYARDIERIREGLARVKDALQEIR